MTKVFVEQTLASPGSVNLFENLIQLESHIQLKTTFEKVFFLSLLVMQERCSYKIGLLLQYTVHSIPMCPLGQRNFKLILFKQENKGLITGRGLVSFLNLSREVG